MNTFINNQRLAQLAGVNYDSEKIQPGPIVYSRTHTVVEQFEELSKYPSCVLVTSFSDASVTDEMAEALPKNVRRWFSNNVMTNNPRVTAVPIGLRTSAEGETILKEVMKSDVSKMNNFVYLNAYRRIKRTPNPRRGLYERFLGTEWITVEGGFEHVPMKDFYTQIKKHNFIISPPGAGPDCHRHWEALHLGSIPVVLKSKATDILKDLPCVRLNDWCELTKEKLINEFPKQIKKFNTQAMNKIWFEYWKEEIKKA